MTKDELITRTQRIHDYLYQGSAAMPAIMPVLDGSYPLARAEDDFSVAEEEASCLSEELNELDPYDLEEMEIDGLELDELSPLYDTLSEQLEEISLSISALWSLYLDLKESLPETEEEDLKDYLEDWQEQADVFVEEYREAFHQASQALDEIEDWLYS